MVPWGNVSVALELSYGPMNRHQVVMCWFARLVWWVRSDPPILVSCADREPAAPANMNIENNYQKVLEDLQADQQSRGVHRRCLFSENAADLSEPRQTAEAHQAQKPEETRPCGNARLSEETQRDPLYKYQHNVEQEPRFYIAERNQAHPHLDAQLSEETSEEGHADVYRPENGRYILHRQEERQGKLKGLRREREEVDAKQEEGANGPKQPRPRLRVKDNQFLKSTGAIVLVDLVLNHTASRPRIDNAASTNEPGKQHTQSRSLTNVRDTAVHQLFCALLKRDQRLINLMLRSQHHG